MELDGAQREFMTWFHYLQEKTDMSTVQNSATRTKTIWMDKQHWVGARGCIDVLEGLHMYGSITTYVCVQAGGGAETAPGRKVNPNREVCSEEVQTLQSC